MKYKDFLQQFDFPLFLAPMEDVTDLTFRRLCKQYGADVMISEFVSSDALSREVESTKNKIRFDESERPFGIQIFGQHVEALVKAAQMAEAMCPDFIDINWGCPVKKIVSKGAGAAILKDIPKMIALTKAVVESVSLPVTVKTRLGWDESDKPIVAVAEQLQDVGIQAITIHGRTRAQQYGGTADWSLIGAVKNNPRMIIPVIGNGDIDSPDKAVEYKNRYGVDAVMIGRAAIGNPWIFKAVKDTLAGRTVTAPSYEQRVELCLFHLQQSALLKGERTAVLKMRHHYGNYFKGIPFFKEKKIALMQALTFDECKKILETPLCQRT